MTKVNRDDQTIFGHSLGGLAVLEALFTEPGAFRTFVAASPSIYWGDSVVLKGEARFSELVSSGKVAPRVLITVGGEEQDIPKIPPALEAQRAAIEEGIKKARMVGNACDLAGRLKALHGAPGYEVSDCAVFPAQAHGISPWPAIGRAVSFAYPH
jgi:predicted alpha/beta superfamily hydrolase